MIFVLLTGIFKTTEVKYHQKYKAKLDQKKGKKKNKVTHEK